MPQTIPNLWSPQVKVDVVTPYAILQVQANLLSQITQGILQGDIETEMGQTKVQHRLVIIAPAYNGYRHTLVVVHHKQNLPYPADVLAETFASSQTAHSDTELQDLIGQVLQSKQSLAMILSLIANSSRDTNPSESTLMASAPVLSA